jgi:hypothetical protein
MMSIDETRHPELPESPYEKFFPIPGPCDWRHPREPKFERFPIASFSTGFEFGKSKSLLNLSGCFNLPDDQTAGIKPQSAQSKRFGVAFRSYPESKMRRSKSETVYSRLVPVDIRGRGINNVLRKNSNASNQLVDPRVSAGSLHSQAKVSASKNSSKRPSISSSALKV